MSKFVAPFFWKGVLIFIGILLTLYIGACLFLYSLQTRLIFFPPSEITTTPAQVNLPYEEVWLPVSTGKIHGWWIPASNPKAPVLLYFHGNGSNIGDCVNRALRFHQIGLSVMLIDYRGYGKSSGPFPNESLVYEDARTALNYLVETRKIASQNIFLFGESLGGAIAIETAVQHPNLAGIIVESTFTSIRAVIDEEKLYPIFPIDLILTQRFNSLAKIRLLKVPILIIHGTGDETIPAKMSQQLYDAAPEPKQLLLVPEADHNNVALVGGIEYLQTIEAFIKEVRDRQ
jgi:uncharacterized protein